MQIFSITTETYAFTIHVKGRNAWTLNELLNAGQKGCTPIDNPAPRWSAYVHNLRGMGVDIETIRENHGGEFAGHHARYVLRCHVERLDSANVA